MSSCVTAPIAIVGVACRLPGGVRSLDDLWALLAEERDAVTEVPSSRWDTARFLHPQRDMAGHTVSVCAGVLDNIYDFDPAFFGISRKEAEAMDPQQRLLLELTWEAFEDAQIAPSQLAGSDTAVFVGAASPDAGTCHADDICATSPYSMTGTNLSIIANRIAYIYNFHGPSLTIDTACSSAMYALHQACQTLASGGAGMAVAGGANVLLAPYPFVGFSQAHMLSPDGHCKVFDASGNGYVRAEGGGILLLQPLDVAIREGRHIHAIIRGIGTNSDGRTQGIALPSAEAQEQLLRDVYASAGLSPEQLAYVEAHGTGTAAGDPVETAAIGRALGMGRKKPLVIGSVKCNLGHLETASAMAGIMKSLLVLRERRVPPQIHLHHLNPAIDCKGLNVRVPLHMTPLGKMTDSPLVGVNSFGFGGANGHVVLEAGPATGRGSSKKHSMAPIFLSAKSETSLRMLAGLYADSLHSIPDKQYDLAFGGLNGREMLPQRLVVCGNNAAEQETALRAFASEKESPLATYGETTVVGEKDRTAFVFAGNGGQWAGMGKALLANKAFASKAREVAKLMQAYGTGDVLEQLSTITPEAMERTENAQQLLFVVQVGLCAALEEMGIVADVAFGHSVGEVAAAWYCGALSLKEAVRVIYWRSFWQGKTAGLGKMAAAGLSFEEATLLARQYGDVEVAANNDANSVTLTGNEESLIAIGNELQRDHVFFKMLPLNYAFHSCHMEGIKKDLLASLKGLRGKKAVRLFISTVTGACHQAACNATYWWRNVREPVQFHGAVQTALGMGVRHFMEIGPHSILLRYIRNGFKTADVDGWVGGTLTANGDCLHDFATAWRSAWAHGWPCNMDRHFPRPGNRMDLPIYPWDKQDCQPAVTPECAGLVRARAEHPLLGWRVQGLHSWEQTLDLGSSPWIGDHKVGEQVYYPAAAFLEIVLAAAKLTQEEQGVVDIVHASILRPIVMREKQAVKVRTVVDATDGEVRVLARPFMRDEAWTLHSKARMVHSDVPASGRNQTVLQPENFGEPVPCEWLYAQTEKANMHYGPIFRPITACWRKGNSILARFAPYAAGSQAWEQGMLVPPPLLDGGLQLIFPLIADLLDTQPAPRLPYWFERCTLYKSGQPAFALATLVRASSRNVVCDLDLLDAEGNLLLRLTSGHARTVERLAAPRPAVYATHATPQPHPLAGMPEGVPTTEHLASGLREYCQTLAQKAHWQERQNSTYPLRDMAILALAKELGDGEHDTPLKTWLQEWLHATNADLRESLPPFADIWRTLLSQQGGDTVCNMLLANAGNSLLANARPTPADSPLWQEYHRQEYALGHAMVHHCLDAIKAGQSGGQSLCIHACNVAGQRQGKAHVLLAEHCLHREDNVVAALRECRAQLHGGGYLLVAERTPNSTDNVLHGLHTDWWQEDAQGAYVPRLMDLAEWQRAAHDAGFVDVQCVCGSDFVAGEHSFVLLARNGAAEDDAPQSKDTASWLLVAAHGSLPKDLPPRLLAQGHDVAILPVDACHRYWRKQVKAGRKTICIFAPQQGNALDMQNVQQCCSQLHALVQGWDRAGRPGASLFLVTRQGLPAHAACIGYARVLMNEMPGLDVCILDLHGEDAANRAALCRELLHPTEEREVMLHNGDRQVLRTEEVPVSRHAMAAESALRLECTAPGRLETLAWLPAKMPEPGANGVVVNVRAVGLNFRDVMWAMNMLPEEALEGGFSGPGLGIECAGVVARVGNSVTSVVPGQRVLCFGPQCFASQVVTTADAVAPMPEEWTFAQAATVPVAFFTAWYAIKQLGQMQAGERLLIHGAAGGVGLAAIQIAFGLGLEVYATAGSEDKRHLLRLLGVEHVYDSRSLSFRDAILADTGGQGVDAVLNSLAGEGMDQSLRLLKPFGRFLELGKRDFYGDTPLHLRPFRNNVSFFGIDVDQLMKSRPQLGQTLFKEIMQHFADGAWQPLPFMEYAGSEVETAFRAMQQSRHVGKIVVTPHEVESIGHVENCSMAAMPVRRDASYVISGGLGGFGLATARHLAAQGAGALILLSRSGAGEKRALQLEELALLGLPGGERRQVIAVAQDVSDSIALRDALDTALAGLPPLAGVVHAAAVLDDATIQKMNPAQLERVLRPKVGGAFALHEYTRDKKLDFFVMYSSVTTILGNPGQANYVAANMALEALACLRRKQGLPALAVGWGAIADTGMLARDAATLESLKRVSGIVPMTAQISLEALASLPACEPAPALFAADWKRLARLPIGQTPRFVALRPDGDLQEAHHQSLQQSIAGKSRDEAMQLLTETVTNAVSHILRVASASLKPATPLADLGMDSLMAVELGLALEEMLDGQSLSGGLTAGVSIRDLAGRLYAICSGEDAGQEVLRQSMEATHGIAVSDDLARAVLQQQGAARHE